MRYAKGPGARPQICGEAYSSRIVYPVGLLSATQKPIGVSAWEAVTEIKRELLTHRDTLCKYLLFAPPTFSFTGMVATNERAQGADRWLAQRPRGKGCLSRVPYIVGFICVLVQLASGEMRCTMHSINILHHVANFSRGKE